MKRTILLILISFSINMNSQTKVEFYTNYGYYLDTSKNELLNIDGELYYWYFDWELKESVYLPDSEQGSVTYEADGFLYRKDFKNNIATKTKIKYANFLSENNLMKAVFYLDNLSVIDTVTLTRGSEGKFYFVEMCFKPKSDKCAKSVLHSTYRFEDDNYKSRMPSQFLGN